MTRRERILQSGTEPAALVLDRLDVVGGCSLRLPPTPSRPPTPSPSCPTAGPPQPGSRWAWSAEVFKQVMWEPTGGVQIIISESLTSVKKAAQLARCLQPPVGEKAKEFYQSTHFPPKKTKKKQLDVLGGWRQHLSGGLGSPVEVLVPFMTS